MIGICPILFVGYKIIMRTRFHKATEIDLFEGVEEIEEYQRDFVPTRST